MMSVLCPERLYGGCDIDGRTFLVVWIFTNCIYCIIRSLQGNAVNTNCYK